MRTPSLLLLAILLTVAPVSLQSAAHTTELLRPEKTTHLRFFLHDTLSGKDPSAVFVARGANREPKPDDPVPFSSLYATDDVLTEGPERHSKVVGNAQGLYISSGRRQLSLVLGMDFELTDGPFNGSAFVVYSRNPVAAHPGGRELAVVGGRGEFRMARGYALLRTHYLDNNTGDAIIEYNVTLLRH
ncbi:Dirigent protein 15 [Dichanthelium oligosanthes]|uniref:Dirigent protein n=1 Tax=Dichanthelium oligosanthes TaxID=888268 RepID=A0A1E5W6P9_9POAL|nr:Dirigent protein 15 [Dichanthelium oligosanthes]